MTKDEELALLDTFIASLPRVSYLHDIFTDGREAIERDIRNDLACGTLAQLESARRQAQSDLAELRAQVKQASAELAQVTRQCQRANDALAELRTDAKRIAAMV